MGVGSKELGSLMPHEHTLEVIYRDGGSMSEDVVRWCSQCGVV
jgi:hypothetical protein